MSGLPELRSLLARVQSAPLIAPSRHSTTMWVPYRHVDESDWQKLSAAVAALIAVVDAAEEVLDFLPLLDENERWDASITALRAAVNAAKEEGHNELENY